MRIISILWILSMTLIQSCKNQESESREELKTVDSSQISKQKIISIERIAQLAESGLLHEHFDKAKISSKIQVINEGTDKGKSIWIFQNTKNEVQIDFHPTDSTRVYRVTSIGRENEYYSESGVKPGMKVEQLNTLNNKPIDFYGFEWDYAGGVNFNDGNLENKNIFVYLKAEQKYDKNFIGDNLNSYEEAQATGLDLYVDKIIFEPFSANKI